MIILDSGTTIVAAKKKPKPDTEFRDAAFLLRAASHPVRLRLLVELATGEREVDSLAPSEQLRGSYTLSYCLTTLLRAGLISRRRQGLRRVYALTLAGVGVVNAYRALCHREGNQSIESMDRAPAGHSLISIAPAPDCSPSSLFNGSDLIDYAANAHRIRTLLALANDDRSAADIARRLGEGKRDLVIKDLKRLEGGGFIASKPGDHKRDYRLTPVGAQFVNMLRAMTSTLDFLPGEAQGETPTVATLARLMATFRRSDRLRVLHLLVTCGPVCDCHLPVALEMSGAEAAGNLLVARREGFVLTKRASSRVFHSASRLAVNLHRSLMGHFGERLNEMAVFEADAARFRSLSHCELDEDAASFPKSEDCE